MSAAIREDPAAVQALSQRLADVSAIPEIHIQKDLWVSEALRVMAAHAANRPYKLVFKGGTSLSKAHGLISRFSEDIDLLLVFSDEGPAARESAMRSLLESVESGLGVTLDHEPVLSPGKKRGHHRAAEFGWSSHEGTAGVGPTVLVELGVDGGSIPNSLHALTPLLASLAADAGIPFEYEEAAPFEVVVMAPERTLTEKLMLVHTVASDRDATQQAQRRAARHYYDIYCLLNSEDVRAAVDGQAMHLAREIHLHSTGANRPSKKRPASGFASSAAFDTSSLAATRHEYETRVMGDRGLVWKSASIRPTFDDCLAQVHRHSDLL